MYPKKVIPWLSILFFLNILLTARVCAVSWSANLTQLTTHDVFDGYASVAQLHNRMVTVVWAREVIAYPKIYCRNSSDCGTTWSEETNLTDNYGDYADLSPSLTQSTNGTIWIVWASNRPPPTQPPKPDFSIDASPSDLAIQKGDSDNSTIIISSLNDFSEPVDLSVINPVEHVTTTLDPEEVTPPPNGIANSTLTMTVGTSAATGNYTLWVMGKSSSQSHLVEIRLEIVDSYSSSSSSSSSFVSLAEAASSAVNLYKIYYKTSPDYGATWSKDIQLEPTSASEDTRPSILQAMNGTLWIVWQSYRTGNHELFFKTSSDGGASWSEGEQLTDNPHIDRAPSITQTMDGRIWVTWTSYRTGQSEIYYKTYDGTLWSSDTRLTYSTNIDSAPSILQSYEGTIWIFWASAEDSDTATADIYYKYSLDDGTSWSDRIQFTSHAEEDMWPSITQTDDLKIWVGWSSNRTSNLDLFYKTTLVGDITGPVGQPDNIVNAYDFDLVAEGFGLTEGDANWNEYEAADLTGPENPPDSMCYPPDKTIDIHDLATIGKNYGET